MDLFSISAIVAAFCYFICVIAVVTRLFTPKGPNLLLILSFAGLSILAHMVSSNQLIFAQNQINFALPNVISLVSLAICLTVSILALRYKINLLLPVTYFFAGLWQVAMLFIPHHSQIPLATDQPILFIHITLALIAYCVLVIATLYAFQVAYINMKLKSKNLQAVSHLPPLMQVEGQLFIILAIGTICLFMSQILGIVFIEHFIRKDNAHKTVLSLLALSFYLWILWGHYKKGWRGHRVLILTIVATSLLTLAYFGSRFIKEFLLY
ncbi:cytochrome C assembly family protein [Thalassotalea profundi]|uniref:Inner membrane protein YpjD n=1 Tax=Thalassotalea profundi TaxID=2036687 RepID=A0ABQ3IKI2_9GAMM|nr:cytochrome c biogenesis protein CcsA [Thalassotalea profundi]GHE81695.1 inner membrane protein YpjD [Thalassotalea profundi]